MSLTDALGGESNGLAGGGGEPAHFSLQDIAKETGGTAGRVVLDKGPKT